MSHATTHWHQRLPFYYGWLIVGIAFVTMAISVNARTSFSLLLPALIGEFGWERGLAAGAFSFGFLFSAVLSPFVGRVMDHHGPRLVIGVGVVLMASGLLLAPWISKPWHLYATLGVLVGGGANLMSFTAQSLYLPHWFVQRRGLAISIAFSGVGVGAIIVLPWQQSLIVQEGWRAACWAMGLVLLLVVAPLNLLVRHRPENLGLQPDGTPAPTADPLRPDVPAAGVVDTAWAATEWTLQRALRTGRFWWITVGYFCALFAWYAVQVHQTQYLIDLGYNATVAAWALGIVAVVAIPGQIFFGALSDRIGREWVWTVGCIGFAICYAALIAMELAPSLPLLYLMVASQGFLGYALTSVMGPIVAEIFHGPHYGTIFGAITVALIGGGAIGPWLTGVIHDSTGSYRLAFSLAIVCCIISAFAIWRAGPRTIRLVPGRRGR